MHIVYIKVHKISSVTYFTCARIFCSVVVFLIHTNCSLYVTYTGASFYRATVISLHIYKMAEASIALIHSASNIHLLSILRISSEVQHSKQQRINSVNRYNQPLLIHAQSIRNLVSLFAAIDPRIRYASRQATSYMRSINGERANPVILNM